MAQRGWMIFPLRSKGEILGVAGVAGSGQKELCETIAGLMQAKEGAILYKRQICSARHLPKLSIWVSV